MVEKKIIDSEKIYHNGINNAVKSVVYEMEAEIYEMAKSVDENKSVVIELRLVDKREGIADPFEKVEHSTGKRKKHGH